MFRKVLAYFDGSVVGRKAVKTAIYIAGVSGSKLIIISSVNPLDELESGLEYEEDIEKELRSLMEDAKEAGVDVESRLLFGSPLDAIVKTVDFEHPDLVVLPALHPTGTLFGRGEPLHTKITKIYSNRGVSFLITSVEEY